MLLLSRLILFAAEVSAKLVYPTRVRSRRVKRGHATQPAHRPLNLTQMVPIALER